jgi:hypothetical protein
MEGKFEITEGEVKITDNEFKVPQLSLNGG